MILKTVREDEHFNVVAVIEDDKCQGWTIVDKKGMRITDRNFGSANNAFMWGLGNVVIGTDGELKTMDDVLKGDSHAS